MRNNLPTVAMDLRRSEHIALILPDSSSSSDASLRGNRRSWLRQWNQYTRLQRSLTLMLIFVVTAATVFTLFSTDSWWQPQLQESQQQQDDIMQRMQVLPAPNAGRIEIAPYRLSDNDKAQAAADAAAAAAVVASQNADNGVAVAPPPPQMSPPKQQPHRPNVAKQMRRPGVLPPLSHGQLLADENSNQVDAPFGERSATGNANGPAVAAAVQQQAPDLLLETGGPKDFKGPANDRQKAVVAAFRHAWTGYKEFAWGHDNLKPISMASHDWFGLGLTIVDALDTMYIMDLQDEFDEARDWVDQHLRFDVNRDMNLFEVTIRVMGGLLSAYHLSGDKMFVEKATDLGQRLMPCFDSPSGIPFSDVNLARSTAHSPKWSPDSSTSEVTTIQLEFRDLARSTGTQRFAQVVDRINEIVHGLDKTDGLVPIFINANTGTFRSFATVSLGARGDSYYEYLLKQWLQSGKRTTDEFLLDDYRTAIAGVLDRLVRQTPSEHHVYVGELINGKDFKPKMDHLTCYLPGTLLLGTVHANQPAAHRKLADDLLETCYQTYMKQPTQLAAEITYFNIAGETEADMYVKSNDAHNLLRPEFVESLYYYWALTGNTTYQDMGWTIFQAFERYTRVRAGYTSIGNVKNALNTRPRDMMESFFVGETLKYFYLLFSDDRREVDLDKYVFNTEAHLMPIWSNGGSGGADAAAAAR